MRSMTNKRRGRGHRRHPSRGSDHILMVFSLIIFSLLNISNLSHIILLCHIVADIILMLAHPIGRGKQYPRGGKAGGIRGYFERRVDGAAGLARTTSTPTPDSNPYTRPGIPFGVHLDEYNNKPQKLNRNLDTLRDSGLATTSTPPTGLPR